MNKRRARQHKSEHESVSPLLLGKRLKLVALVGAIALTVATPLHPTEAGYESGSEAPFVLLWIAVGIVAAAASLTAGAAPQRLPHDGSPSDENDSLKAAGAGVRFLWTDARVLVVWGLIAWVVLSALAVGSAGHFRLVLNAIWQWVGYGVSFGVLLWLASDKRYTRALLLAALAAGMASALYGLYEWKWIHPEIVRQYEQDPEGVLKQAGIVAPPGSPQRRQFEDRLTSTEPYSTFGLPNSLAAVLATWTVFAVGALIPSLRRPARNPAWLGITVVAAIVMGACLLLTKSRTAWLATLVGLVGLVAMQFRGMSRRGLTIGAGVVVVAVVVGTVWLWQVDPLVIAEAPLSVRYRLEYWAGSLSLLRDHIWTGCGVGNFQAFYPQYMQPWSSETVADPHNLLFDLLANSGLPAGLLAVALIPLALKRVGGAVPASCDETRSDTDRTVMVVAVAAGMLLAVIGLLFYSLLQQQSPDIELMILIVASAALATVTGANWVAEGAISRGVIGWSLVTWLVNAAAAGAIGIWGVAHGMWLLAAIWIVLTPRASSPGASSSGASSSGATHPTRPGRTARVAAVLAGLTVLFMMAWQTEARPVLRSHLLAGEAETAYDERDAERAWEQAAAADPYWAGPWERLAVIRLGAYLANPTSGRWQAFEESVAEATRRNRHAAPLYRQVGDWYLVAREVAGTLPRRGDQDMIGAYRKAVQLHPANAFYHAQLAWGYHMIGDDRRAAVEAQRALALDGLVPHEELKLANRTLLEGREPSIVSAERRMRELRNREHPSS